MEEGNSSSCDEGARAAVGREDSDADGKAAPVAVTADTWEEEE